MTEKRLKGKIVICQADEVVKKVAELKPAAVLSIEHPGVKQGEAGFAPRLTDGTPQMILCFWDSEQLVERGPDIEQVEQGLAFAMEHIMKGDIIIHCQGGISRSTAVTLGVLSQLNPGKGEEELIKMLLDIRPIAAPNIIIVDLVDQLTGRDGRLLHAVNDNAGITAARKKSEAEREIARKEKSEKIIPLAPRPGNKQKP